MRKRLSVDLYAQRMKKLDEIKSENKEIRQLLKEIEPLETAAERAKRQSIQSELFRPPVKLPPNVYKSPEEQRAAIKDYSE